jgi:ABC-type Fe3+/spermidine/putrescine transport system ATPase subunit
MTSPPTIDFRKDADAYLSIANLRVGFSGVPVVSDVSLDVRRGEFLVLLGPSGCGKSTILKTLAGLIAADAGTIILDGTRLDPMPSHRRDIGLVFQNYALFPHMNVAANVRFGLDMRGVSRAEAAARVAEALAMVRLADVEHRMPSQLSGGQQQRVALARALVVRPRLLLLDEPLSNLDATLRAQMRFELKDLHQRAGLTTIMVTHDQVEAMAMADRIAVMQAGAIRQTGTPSDIYDRPADPFVATFVGTPPAALLPLSVAPDGAVQIDGTPWSPPLAMHLTPGESLLCLRPERATLVAPDTVGALPARVVGAEYLGADWLVHVVVGGTPAIVRANAPAPRDTMVGIGIPADAPVFDGGGALIP